MERTKGRGVGSSRSGGGRVTTGREEGRSSRGDRERTGRHLSDWVVRC